MAAADPYESSHLCAGQSGAQVVMNSLTFAILLEKLINIYVNFFFA